MSRKLLMLFTLFVGICLVVPCAFAAPGSAKAATPTTVGLPHTDNGEPLCINYWPEGKYLGERWKFVSKDASPEEISAAYRAGMIEIAAEHGRADLVEKLMRAEVDVYFVPDRATFETEAGFAPPQLPSFMSTAAVESVLAPVSEVTPVEDLGYSTDSGRRRPPSRGVPCICSSHVCGFDVCGKTYCSGPCGGCGFCG